MDYIIYSPAGCVILHTNFVIQKRFDGSVDFFRNWTYKAGFGSASSEYWLGNDVIHQLTSHRQWALRIKLTHFRKVSLYVQYNTFRIADEADKYRLTTDSLGSFAGHSMSSLNESNFSTYDNDNDQYYCNTALNHKHCW